ncbi:hypothetical protein HPP92_020229 [Vanilla planifolia]|uniref:RING-type domain-containing protein n=1 Tax=Vanilla planifolia TaxID=51239 RepID=A0A835UHP5_VANPL|nr:hypothetical protein HPP92_020229 [Vanilla planifolia]
MTVAPPPQAQQQPLSIFSLQPHAAVQRGLYPPVMMGTSQAPPPVSTGLCLALDERNVGLPHDSTLSAFFSEALASQLNKQMNEIEQFFFTQGEQLRQTLAERRQRHHHALLAAAEESIGRRLREKELEIERAVRRSAELEDRLARLRTETIAWQAKAMAEQASAASLHAQIQKAAAAAVVPAGKECYGESPAEDAESAFIDPERSESPEQACRACFRRPALVVLIPCRHLCLCSTCDANGAGEVCPVCGFARTGSVQVVLP